MSNQSIWVEYSTLKNCYDPLYLWVITHLDALRTAVLAAFDLVIGRERDELASPKRDPVRPGLFGASIYDSQHC